MTIHTPETKAEIGRLAATGLSASEIAAEMGLKSRHVVIGMADRNPDLIQLQGKAAGGRPKGCNQKPSHAMRVKRSGSCGAKPPPMLCEHIQDDAPDDPVTFSELEPHHCKWPIGLRDYIFCGRTRIDGQPYCGGHCRIAFNRKADISCFTEMLREKETT
jgi:GcrA cell cycle regulator